LTEFFYQRTYDARATTAISVEDVLTATSRHLANGSQI
jgi:hypothetical protein